MDQPQGLAQKVPTTISLANIRLTSRPYKILPFLIILTSVLKCHYKYHPFYSSMDLVTSKPVLKYI